MELKDIVVSLELAKELKENGYPQEAVFSYFKPHNVHYDREWEVRTTKDVFEMVLMLPDFGIEFIAAPTTTG